ncbi:MAG: hypothetical protein KDD22_01420 [Bdellovibrionales bacterium]|nr:hypothetical protein [Bdellovibrionales bacterium]
MCKVKPSLVTTLVYRVTILGLSVSQAGRKSTKKVGVIIALVFLTFLVPFEIRAASSNCNNIVNLELRTKILFGTIMNRYDSQVVSRGFDWGPELDWQSENFSAGVTPDYSKGDNIYKVYITGAIARRFPGLDEVALMLLHEVGHLLGQGPFMKPIFDFDAPFARVEGEADYFAGSHALALISEEIIDREFVGYRDNPQYENAKQYFKKRGIVSEKNLDAHARIAVAAYNAIHFIMEDEILPGTLSFETPDPTEVPQTMKYYPSPQARLDSILAGMLNLPRPRSWAHPRDF